MGHDRRYVSFSVDKSRQYIADEVMDRIAHNGDRYGSTEVRFLDGVCDNYDEAYALLEQKCEGVFYPSFAVQYLARSREKSKAVQDADARLQKLCEARNEYIRERSVHRRKSAFFGCPRCGSKLSSEYLKGEQCPVCRCDLRPQSTLDKIKDYDAKINAASKVLTDAYNKNKVTAKEWLVVYEFHC